jgi:hypothetical protein
MLWLRIKCVQPQAFVISGYVPSAAGADMLGSLVRRKNSCMRGGGGDRMELSDGHDGDVEAGRHRSP